MIRIFIVSTIALYREGLSTLLASREGMEVVGAAVDESDAVATLRCLRVAPPDILLVDMSSANSASAARWLMQEIPDADVFAITCQTAFSGRVWIGRRDKYGSRTLVSATCPRRSEPKACGCRAKRVVASCVGQARR